MTFEVCPDDAGHSPERNPVETEDSREDDLDVLTPVKELNRKRWEHLKHQELLDLAQFQALESQLLLAQTDAEPADTEVAPPPGEEGKKGPRDAGDDSTGPSSQSPPSDVQPTICHLEHSKIVVEKPEAERHWDDPNHSQTQEELPLEDSTFVKKLISPVIFPQCSSSAMTRCRFQRMSRISSGPSR